MTRRNPKNRAAARKPKASPNRNQGMDDVPQWKGQADRRDTSLAMVSQPQTFSTHKTMHDLSSKLTAVAIELNVPYIYIYIIYLYIYV